MALFGNKDTKAITGTVDVTNNSATLTGTGTAFTTELKSGNTVVIANVEYRVVAIASNTSATLHTVYAGTTASGLTITANEQPAYLSNGELAQVYGVDSTEATIAANRAKGINTPGWVKYTTYTDAQSNTRHKAEVLVAMSSITGDAADDAVVADA
jgi:hypothetical protein